MTPRLNTGKGVSGAVRYVFGQGRDPKTGELKPEAANDNESRVDWISGQGFGFKVHDRETADIARRVMEFDALNQKSRTRKCEQDCVHLSLSWKPGETPSQQQMEEAARDALKALGMENAKALFVAHNDEDAAHVHIVASKINPATGRAYDLAGSWRTLSRWAQQHELAHGGILCTRREGANELRDAIADRDADRVLSALTKQRATFTDAQLHRALEKEIIGPVYGENRIAAEKELARFHREVLARPQLVELVDDRTAAVGDTPARRFTTRAVLDAEQQVVTAVHDLAQNLRHSVSDRTRNKVAAGKTMSDEQTAAFIHATLAGGFAIIDGQAGTGKSYTIAAVREAYEASRCNVIGLAPTNAVAQDMRADGFRHAATIHSELFALNNGKRRWDAKTVVIVDEAAMLDTKLMAMVTSHAADAGAKLILVGDDRQLSSIDHGGMFAVLKDRHGAAELAEVKRQLKNDERRASEMFASGNFHDALNIYDQKGAIHWTRTQGEARAELIDQWTQDSAAAPEKTRFVFAYTNADVATLNAALRDVRKQRGELGDDHQLKTAYGRLAFAAGDRIQFNATEKKLGIVNGAAGTVESIEGSRVTVMLDGRHPRRVIFDAATFDKFRHGYAGTIYKGQGRTLDQTYLYHSEHWRSASSYVAMTRHRDKAALFVARNTAKDVKQLARQMGRTDDRRAASMFAIKTPPAPKQQPAAEERPRLSPAELLSQLAPQPPADDTQQQRDSTPGQPANVPPAAHRGERQAGRYDEIAASHRAAEPAPRRYDVLREAGPPPIVGGFRAAGRRTAEPPAENFDRDAADAEWIGKVEKAGIAHGSKSAPKPEPQARPPIIDDTYPDNPAGNATDAADAGTGTKPPADALTATAPPQTARTGLLSGLARLLFGKRWDEAVDAPAGGLESTPEPAISSTATPQQPGDAPRNNEAEKNYSKRGPDEITTEKAATMQTPDSERHAATEAAADSDQNDDLTEWTPKRRQRQRRGQSL